MKGDKIAAKVSGGPGREFEGEVTNVYDTFIVVKFEEAMQTL